MTSIETGKDRHTVNQEQIDRMKRRIAMLPDGDAKKSLERRLEKFERDELILTADVKKHMVEILGADAWNATCPKLYEVPVAQLLDSPENQRKSRSAKELVFIETPYKDGDRNRNLRYLSWCEYHSAEWMGELPIASHGNCTAYWPEDDEHRAKGFEWRNQLRGLAKLAVFYEDIGFSDGMNSSKIKDAAANRPYEVRRLPEVLMRKFDAGEYPPGTMRRVAFEVRQ